MNILLHSHHLDLMKRDVMDRSPEEACGLVAGIGGESVEVFPVANILHSPVRFRMDPKEQIRLLLHFIEVGWDLLAIYHSHPSGPSTPSQVDIVEAAYPEAVHLLWSHTKEGNFKCRAFLIYDHSCREIYFTKIS